jgi:hypothetical protein
MGEIMALSLSVMSLSSLSRARRGGLDEGDEKEKSSNMAAVVKRRQYDEWTGSIYWTKPGLTVEYSSLLSC